MCAAWRINICTAHAHCHACTKQPPLICQLLLHVSFFTFKVARDSRLLLHASQRARQLLARLAYYYYEYTEAHAKCRSLRAP